jgi:hypothetical protein
MNYRMECLHSSVEHLISARHLAYGTGSKPRRNQRSVGTSAANELKTKLVQTLRKGH